MAKKDAEQAARGKLRQSGDYADARTVLAQEQADRIRQIRLEAEGKLIQADEVRRFMVGAGQSLNVRLRGIEKRLRTRFPELPPEVMEFVRGAHEEALGLLAAEVRGAGESAA